ncbi:glycosyltransferase family 2 protein [Clostridium sp. SHJSY1]|uniref:glycosyltransferase family 2 protein n=1 Tax=Clostridium sp. SHJSY1 TaxID=2942483 RepID=UPI00287666A5|nr:glycosyltransferase family 2 protein [Clostridium sp. SHJSY1]MDS0525972.1 glycosyltransferase family 2 protein [Clostridium sp. SHJSY1]
MNDKSIQYSVVVPLYNEELVVSESYKRLKEVMDSTNEEYEIIFVNDGSKDKTAELTKDICSKDSRIKFISFSRNFGHQLAITAGMDNSSGKAVIVIDADLQDPPEVMLEMIKKWKEGYEVVYGKRIKRKGETFFKKVTAKIFYRTLSSMTDIDIPVDTGDFRLIDRKVCDALKKVPERNRYVRGLVSWLGFKQAGVEFIREDRFAGETKYPLKKMIKFATDAITSFSYKPLKIGTYLGGLVSAFSFLYLLFILFQKMFTNSTVPGWTSIIGISLFFNGVMFMMLGIIGEYVGRIYDEAKGRPLYIIGEKKGF